MGDFVLVSALSLVAVAVLMAVTARVGFWLGRHNVVDVTWGVAFVVIAGVAGLAGSGSVSRRIVIFVLVGIWGCRLAWHLYVRTRGHGEDPRYEKLLAGSDSVWVPIRKIYVTQALVAWFISLPIQVVAVSDGPLGWIAFAGIMLWIVGVTFEAVGDHQLRQFKARRSSRGKVMNEGLWAWTRHPNYFGDACVWWGIYLIAADVWPGALTVLSPVVMTYFLVFATGARLLEKHMQERPGFREYQQTTSFFVPLPPKSRV
ncbi:DUF1295 domain-containing protein [Hoyosella rhizosphaerae]|uniref:Steroid 5-alpha reductase C-terminal domain-containing protein n=1 Tax=Hoyosella rhizosphaerae TaxID=1755582 RepID=A0A916X8S5_9ACTN|nr:DUF1295 domain-containing protein [Hoyosella rhizosphaerae]MBN4927271.1 DUF1295 domain-containing protein [Hoyosella rhizosphaerae]GGC52585.1 hypothetical protein GCM10011410_01150 [Hoyosella rhizosphaerae]